MSEQELLIPKLGYVSLIKRSKKTLAFDRKECFDHGIDINDFYRKENLVYFFVVDGEIIKIGQSSRSMADRIYSYNSKRKSGKTEKDLIDGVMSLGKKVNVYIEYIEGNIEFNGLTTRANSVMIEQAYLELYKEKFGKLPLLNKICG